uniref:Uncharacterized protein n=1 Tax=Salix viminalis TaxID=40686 RepID=A0A6N2L0Q2_SALVM
MMTKNEQAGGYTEAAPVRRHARAALPVCALGVRSAVSQIAAAKPALTSPGMQKFEFNALAVLISPFYLVPFHGIVASFCPHS